jgi:deoxycytidylate deaminase
MSTRTDRETMKLETFVSFAVALSMLSTCRRRSVGCVIVPRDFTRVYSIGYNGPPRGSANDSCTGEQLRCGCVHAEANAISKLQTEREDLLLITTTSPCPSCAGLIINSGRVDRVVYIELYTDGQACLDLMAECGVYSQNFSKARQLGI